MTSPAVPAGTCSIRFVSNILEIFSLCVSKNSRDRYRFTFAFDETAKSTATLLSLGSFRRIHLPETRLSVLYARIARFPRYRAVSIKSDKFHSISVRTIRASFIFPFLKYLTKKKSENNGKISRCRPSIRTERPLTTPRTTNSSGTFDRAFGVVRRTVNRPANADRVHSKKFH